MTGLIEIGYRDLALAALLLCANAGLSMWLGLRLERQLLVAAVRMVVQLLLIGLVLKALFALATLATTLLAILVMGLFAGHEIRARQAHRLRGWKSYGFGALTVLRAGFLVTVFALLGPLRPDPWFAPRYAIPLFGMILGNAMTGISLGLNTLTNSMCRDAAAIEAQLMLGRTIWEATRPVARRALRGGLMPIINSMAATPARR